MYFLLTMVIFQPAMLVYQRVCEREKGRDVNIQQQLWSRGSPTNFSEKSCCSWEQLAPKEKSVKLLNNMCQGLNSNTATFDHGTYIKKPLFCRSWQKPQVPTFMAGQLVNLSPNVPFFQKLNSFIRPAIKPLLRGVQPRLDQQLKIPEFGAFFWMRDPEFSGSQ